MINLNEAIASGDTNRIQEISVEQQKAIEGMMQKLVACSDSFIGLRDNKCIINIDPANVNDMISSINCTIVCAKSVVIGGKFGFYHEIHGKDSL